MRYWIVATLVGLSFQAFCQVDLQQGLVACYTFTGNADDGSGNSRHGTVAGAVLATDRFGSASCAYQFDGMGSYIIIPAGPLVNTNYSYSLWMKATSVPGFGRSTVMLSVGDATTSMHQTLSLANVYSSAGTVGISAGGYNNTSPYTTTSAESGYLPTLETWYHLVSVRENGEMRLYMNGQLVRRAAPASANSPYYGTDIQAVIGGRCNISQFFHGVIDDVTLYNRPLTLAEIEELYQHGIPCGAPPPIEVNVTDQTKCGAGSFTLTASGNAQYKWYDAETGGSLLQEGTTYTTPWLTQTTSYYVTGTLNGTTSNPKKVTITVLTKPELTCPAMDSVLVGTNVTYAVTVASGQPPFSYTFDFGDGTVIQTLRNSANYTYTNVGSRQISVHVEDGNHCTASCDAFVGIVEEEDEVVFIPNVITPDNEDHLNDVFTLYVVVNGNYVNYTGPKEFSMIIKNRWGREVFSTARVDDGWRAQNTSSGTYFYLIKLGTKQYKGWVHVVK